MNQRQITDFLLRQTAGMPPDALIGHLLRAGIVSPCRCEQAAIRAEVDRLVRSGAGRCEAMEHTADAFRCSSAKVRQAVYYKPKI